MRESRTISGSVNILRRPAVTVTLVDATGRERMVDAHLDTGFTGDLTLPPTATEQLDLSFVAFTSFRTGTGQLTEFSTYAGSVLWQGAEHEVNVLESNVFPLIGVGLLWGNNLSVDFEHGGDVSITELEDD